MNIFPENKASFDSFLLTRNQKKNLTTVIPPWPKKDVSITNILSLKDKISVFDYLSYRLRSTTAICPAQNENKLHTISSFSTFWKGTWNLTAKYRKQEEQEENIAIKDI